MGTTNNITSPSADPNTNAVNALNQITLAIAQLSKTMNAVFPQIIGTSLTATSGAIQNNKYVGYLVLTDPQSGGTVKVGYYAD
jgi:hypothetical protein